METNDVVIEETFNAQISKVWNALTDKEEMKQWYFDLKEFKPEVGFKFDFIGGAEDGEQYVHLCEVTSVKPNQKLSYTWKYKGYSGNSEVIFELTDEVDQTTVKLTHKGLDTFPKDNPDLGIHNFVEDCNHLIHKSLKNHLEK